MAMIEASRPSTSPSASTRCQLRVTSAGFMDRVFMISDEQLVYLGSAAQYGNNRLSVNKKATRPIGLAMRYHDTTWRRGQPFPPRPSFLPNPGGSYP